MKKAFIHAVFLTALLLLGNQYLILGQSVLLNEDFDYPSGSLLTNNGWTAHSGAGTQPITVNNGGLSFSGYVASGIGNAALVDNTGEDDHRIFTAQTAGTVYVGFMVKVSVNSAGYFFHLGQNPIGTTFRGKVFTDATNHFGVSVGSNTGTFATGTFSIGSTYMLVLKYEIISGASNDKVSLFIFDTSLPQTEPASPAVGPLTDATQSDISPASVALRQFSSSQNFVIDGIRVATTWSDMVGVQVSAPTVQAYDVSFSAISGNAMTTSWSNGNGERRVVIMNSNSSITPPSDGTDPTADPVYSGSGQQVVHNNTGSNVGVSGLNSSTTYWFQVFEVNGTGANTKYCTASGANNPNSQATIFVPTAPQVGSPTVASIATNSAVLGGTILSDGGSALTERGTVWSINSPVTIIDNKLEEGGTATGTFSHLRSSLPAGTEIFFAAYAINGVGTTLSPQSSFYTLAIEPSNQATNIGSPTVQHSTITVTWADNNGTQPATGFLIKSNTTGSFTAPVDGIPEADDTVLGDGSGTVNVEAGTNLFTWTSLNPSTTYYFVIYPYTNTGAAIDYKTSTGVPLTIGTTTAVPVYEYTWQGANLADWTVPTNWIPSRTSPSITDILYFSDGTTKTVTGVPTQTISRLIVSGNTKITLQASVAATLTIAGGTGIDVDVPSECELNLGGTNAIILSLASSATASVTGGITFTGGAHRMLSGSAAGVTFNNGSYFKAGTGFTGNAFGIATPYNAIVFGSGSTYISQAGSNPFGASAPNSVVVFQPGSLFKAIASITPAFSGRTYADFELDAPGATMTPTGANAVSIHNLTITNGTLNFNMTGNPGHSIKGNISVAGGANLNFSPSSAGTVNLNGTSSQFISGSGSISGSINSTIVIANGAGISLDASATLNGILLLSNGLLQLTGTGNLNLGPLATISGTPSSATMIVPTSSGQLRKEFPSSGGSFTFPIGDNTGVAEYSPVTLSFTSGTFASGNYVGATLVNSTFPGDPLSGSYINRYWSLVSSGITSFSCDAVFQYLFPGDVFGTEGNITCYRMSPLPATAFAPANTTLHQLTASGLTSFGSFTGTQLDRNLILNLFLEGLYQGSGVMAKAQNESGDQFPGTTADQVTVELHDATPGNYSNIIYSSGLVNLSTGGSLSIAVPSVHGGSYYITIRHRNSIETVSALPVSFAGSTIQYSFTDAASKAFGGNMKQAPDGAWVIFGGDANQDGIVDSGDMIGIDNDVANFVSGYVASDVNGDGLVDSGDMILVDNNGSWFVAAVLP